MATDCQFVVRNSRRIFNLINQRSLLVSINNTQGKKALIICRSSSNLNKGLPKFEYEQDYDSSRKPISHLVNVDRQKLSPYPHLSREDLEEPPPKVCDEVLQIFEKSKARYVNGKWRSAELNARAFAKLRRQYIMNGYYWPDRPMRDCLNQKTSHGKPSEFKQVERWKSIEESMKKMPDIIADYRQRIYNERAVKIKQKEKQYLNKLEGERKGYHPKDPRLLQLLSRGEGGRQKKSDIQTTGKGNKKTR